MKPSNYPCQLEAGKIECINKFNSKECPLIFTCADSLKVEIDCRLFIREQLVCGPKEVLVCRKGKILRLTNQDNSSNLEELFPGWVIIHNL